ncbi:restriction endonuclease subunit R [Chitinophaga caeni]|uniref:Restriction endonuclease subunit R n=1 Tax=Chitinophaga caeni TaxID=2029983 RepID=A0A291QPV3_9BACT|nr:DEAD/DEAH box helicase family protein [Chitinophaga caeni]ATL45884.1 restriction endonuclease subunit R [Chitinophaga caeni]
MMMHFPEGIRFKYPWRSYQQQVLNELQQHLEDDHLHLVAPPGSGKTVLGLEIALRINKPVLILAPTTTTKEQWIQRFCELFLQVGECPDWISEDIRKPRFMTVVTYQALHAACEKETLDKATVNADLGEMDIIEGLKQAGVACLVADEAHHLRNEWWHTLYKVKKALKPSMIGLTATPPYDVSFAEWERYLLINGPISAEISVPELVKVGELCPHQDYLYLVQPAREEYEKLKEFRERASGLYFELLQEGGLLDALAEHPAIIQPEEQLEWIYSNIKVYLAMIIYLHARQYPLQKIHAKIIGDKDWNIPAMDEVWLAELLTYFLDSRDEFFKPSKDLIKKINAKLHKAGCIERNRIDFNHNISLARMLTSSISKLSAIEDIVQAEYNNLGTSSKIVILTDYIRKEYLVNDSKNDLTLNKMGVIPIFEQLRRNNGTGKRIAVLTGSLVIIPAGLKQDVEALTLSYANAVPSMEALPYDDRYLKLTASGKVAEVIVATLTSIFQAGGIDVLIGTQSLLGEGWDAPGINVLILASNIGSFVTSNQMRGRAIRTSKINPGKTANIWHIACIDITQESGGEDIAIMSRRFDTFVGLHRENNMIRNGLKRLDLPALGDIYSQSGKYNERTFLLANRRDELHERWNDAIRSGSCLVAGMEVPVAAAEKEQQQLKSFHFKSTLRYFLNSAISGLLLYYDLVIRGTLKAMGSRLAGNWLLAISLVLGSGVLLFGGKALKALRLYFKHSDITYELKNIAKTLLLALQEVNLIPNRHSLEDIDILVKKEMDGSLRCYLEHADAHTREIYLDALRELLEPIENPRYIIVRYNRKGRMKAADFHAVPKILGQNKETAETFYLLWRKYVGKCDLCYTRSIPGRELLLKARWKALSNQLQKEAHPFNAWQ